MQLKFLVAAIAVMTLGACSTHPVVVETPPPVVIQSPAQAPETVIVPVPMETPAPMPMPASMSLHDQVHNALADGMGAAASGIEVRVDGTKVYLAGHVATKADHARAHDIAHDVPGVTDVDHSGLKVR